MSLDRKEEPYFFASTVLKEEPVVATAAEEFQPAFSPDGKEIAYLENRSTLKVVNLASKQSRTVLAAGPQLLVRRRRPVLPVVAGQQVVPRAVRPARAHLHAGGRSRRRRRQGRGAQPHPERLRRRPAEMGHGRQDDDLGVRSRRQPVAGRRSSSRGDVYAMYLHKGGLRPLRTCRRKSSRSSRSRKTRTRKKDKEKDKDKAEDQGGRQGQGRRRQKRRARTSSSTGTASPTARRG